jgi:hypothetical protein
MPSESSTLLAIDPGYEVSAWVRYDGAGILDHGIEANALLLDRVAREDDAHVTLEAIESYGMGRGSRGLRDGLLDGPVL